MSSSITSPLVANDNMPVVIASVDVDPAYTIIPGHTRYRITLACGCQWWEEHPASAPAPTVGRVLRCRAGHSAPGAVQGAVSEAIEGETAPRVGTA